MYASTKNNPDAGVADLLFYEDFTAPQLDRSVWTVETTGKVHNQEQQAYIDSSETIYTDSSEPGSNGALVFQARYRPAFNTPQGDRFDFVSGRIHTRGKFSFRYGRIAARLKIPVGAGLWPAFWALGENGPWPSCGEIDIMESVGESDWLSVALHGPKYSGETPLVNKKYFHELQRADDWHVCAVECTPDGLFFFIDDELVYRVTRPMVTFYGPWVFDDEKYLILNLALGGIYPYKTNGVSQPYLGLPAGTVQQIQAGRARYLVDWVKVSPL